VCDAAVDRGGNPLLTTACTWSCRMAQGLAASGCRRYANVCFGGLKRNRLFMAASQSLDALYVNAQGASGG
jgi:hypothetical protein